MNDKEFERLLLSVQKPGRYSGGEINSVVKDKNKVDVRFAFCFPDTYEIGMSHLGIKILYSQFNERDDIWCERVFAPCEDFEKIMREKNIPLNIRNTNAPDHPGTMIMESIGDEMDEGGFITGIAGKKGFSIITIAKTGMSSEPGSLLKILNVLAKHEVNVEYLPSGIDNVSLVVSSDKVSRSLYEMLGELQKEVQPNKITVTEHIAIVAAVGRKMAYRPGVSGKIFAKLGENGVNIRMITQGPEELNIIVGVEEKDFEQAIRVLYNSFVKENVV